VDIPPNPSVGLERWRRVAMPALIVAATFVVYLPAVRGGLIWDDTAHVTRPELRSLPGLWRIWTEIGATQQYYPLLHSAFWLQYKLCGMWTPGYHLVNIFLHAANACLVWRILLRLKIPGAFLAAMVFAVHPVHVESVAWITELKNTLSGFFYLSSALIYLRFGHDRRPPLYCAALFLFVLGLLTKTVIATLPAALLVIFWWQRGSLSWSRDVWPLIPWLVLGLAAGLFTAWFENQIVGAHGARFELSWLQRLILSGRIIWFYLSKLVWPRDLVFIYPRWSISSTIGLQSLATLSVILLACAFWAIRRISRAPLAAFLFFVGTLVPVLGFFNVYPFRFSFVADHFQYLASLGIITLASAGAACWLNRASPVIRTAGQVGCVAVLVALGILTFRQSRMYGDLEALYRTTISDNPDSFMPRYNLGTFLNDSGRWQEAIPVLEGAVPLARDDEDRADALCNLGGSLFETGRKEEAVATYRHAIQLAPRDAQAQFDLGLGLAALGQISEAIECYRQALRLKPDFAKAHNSLGLALSATGQRDAAIEHFRQAVSLNRDNSKAHKNLATLLVAAGQYQEAEQHYSRALEIDPDDAMVCNNLAWIYTQSPQRSDRLGPEALRLAHRAVDLTGGKDPRFVETLAVAYAAVGRFSDAVTTAQRAAEIARSAGNEALARDAEQKAAQFRALQSNAPGPR
jgi:tetratricopeptide (TPR) repeat protein